MRSAPDAVKTLLTSTNVVWRADLYTVTLLNGTVYRWTSCDRDLYVSGNTYASGPVMSRRLRQGVLPEIDTLTLNVQGAYLVGSTPIARAAIQGVFDDARIQVDHIVGAYPGDLSKGVIGSWFAGRIAGLDPTPTEVQITCKSDLEQLSIVQLPRFTFKPQCGHVVYDANCGVSKAAFTVTSSVSAVTSASVFAGSFTSVQDKGADHYFNLGVVAFTSGANNGVRRAVRDYLHASKQITLALPLPVAPSVSDTFTIYPGCGRTLVTCQNVFNNLVANRSFPHQPVADGAV